MFIAVGAFSSDVFLTPRNLLNIMWAVSVLGIVALGQTVLLVTRNFDMSVASVIGLAGIVTVLAQLAGLGLAGSIAAGLLTGVVFGVMNGFLVVATGANPFLITLGTNALAYAACTFVDAFKDALHNRFPLSTKLAAAKYSASSTTPSSFLSALRWRSSSSCRERSLAEACMSPALTRLSDASRASTSAARSSRPSFSAD